MVPPYLPQDDNNDQLWLAPGVIPVPGFKLIRKLGSGYFGEVWSAQGPEGLRALKFMKLGSSALSKELNGLDAVRELVHDNVIQIEDQWFAGGYFIISMPLCDCSLEQLLRAAIADGHPGIPLGELISYMEQAAAGIDYLNKRGIVHRDVKPGNLMLLRNQLKIIDFSLAKLLPQSMSHLTWGHTPAFAAPECLDGLPTNKSDLYSLAASYYYLRCNSLLFTTVDLTIGHKILTPALSGLLEPERSVVAIALSKKPEDRYACCAEFVNELRRAASRPSQTPVARKLKPAIPGLVEDQLAMQNPPAAPDRPKANRAGQPLANHIIHYAEYEEIKLRERREGDQRFLDELKGATLEQLRAWCKRFSHSHPFSRKVRGLYWALCTAESQALDEAEVPLHAIHRCAREAQKKAVLVGLFLVLLCALCVILPRMAAVSYASFSSLFGLIAGGAFFICINAGSKEVAGPGIGGAFLGFSGAWVASMAWLCFLLLIPVWLVVLGLIGYRIRSMFAAKEWGRLGPLPGSEYNLSLEQAQQLYQVKPGCGVA